MTQITNLTTEYRTDPLGIDVTAPRFNWQMQTDRAGARQTAYRILAGSQPETLGDLWDSGKVETEQSVHVVYAGKKLGSRQRVYWLVTVWDETGSATQSDPAWFEIGLLKRTDWKAKWIGAALRGGSYTTVPVPYLRKAFSLPGAIASARLYATALGLYECSINGQIVGEDVFTPGWTEYRKRVQYNVYDVTAVLHEGDNAIGALLGDGWAAGQIGLSARQQYVDRPRLFAQLEVTLKDGKTITIVSDSTWKQQFGAILASDLLQGEAHDAQLEMPGWDKPGFNDKRWLPVEVFDDTGTTLVATDGPTVRRIEELKPISDPVLKINFIFKSAIFDLGQNMVGRIRLKGKAPAGTTVTLKFAEVLNPDGLLYTTNLRGARATDYYTFKGEGEEVWEPKFTFHGFRYVELLGYPGDVDRSTITGVVLHSEMTPTGSFATDDPLLNQLQSNIAWGQRGNFVDVPTDCPQRDERLGWTGDIQVFSRTAAFNFDVAAFMTKWAKDVADSQLPNGGVPAVVPNAFGIPDGGPGADGGPAWADAAVICPWTMYLCYGDTALLANNYATMTRFMDFLVDASPGFIRTAPEYKGWPGFGDWLSINAYIPRDLIGTAFLAYDASLMVKIADVLGKPDDAAKYRKLFADTKAAFGKRYLKGSKIPKRPPQPSEARAMMDQADRISQGNLKMQAYDPLPSEVYNTDLFPPSQTAYVLGLHFDLLPDNLRPLAVKELVADIERRGNHLSTGFVGASYLPYALSQNGHLDTAYTLLKQTTWPSWAYSVTQGATTIWERWDGWTVERGFQDPSMNSFNHYAYGSIGAWMYSTITGIEIDPAQPGYKHSILRPQPGGELSKASARLKTLYGELVSDWKLDKKGKFDWTVVVPPNTTATAFLPVDGKLKLNGKAASGAVHELTAGTYHFVVG